MKSLLEKVGSIGKDLADSVKGEFDNHKSERSIRRDTVFLVEHFGSMDSLAERLNALQRITKTVNVQATEYTEDGYFVVVIKLED